MWATEEYATSIFKSVIRTQSILIRAPPTRAKNAKNWVNLVNLSRPSKRPIPNLPNLSKTPAKSIDPVVDASTWALGSQICTKYIGNFVKTPITSIRENSLLSGNSPLLLLFFNRVNSTSPLSVLKIRTTPKKGREVNTVNSRRYKLASRRSG